jgi:hypothetical protein
VSTGLEVGWAPWPIWTFWKEKNPLPHRKNDIVQFLYFVTFFYLITTFGWFSIFEVLTAALPRIQFFWDVTPRWVVNSRSNNVCKNCSALKTSVTTDGSIWFNFLEDTSLCVR